MGLQLNMVSNWHFVYLHQSLYPREDGPCRVKEGLDLELIPLPDLWKKRKRHIGNCLPTNPCWNQKDSCPTVCLVMRKRLFGLGQIGAKVEHGLTPDTNQSGTCRNCVLRPVKVVILIQLGWFEEFSLREKIRSEMNKIRCIIAYWLKRDDLTYLNGITSKTWNFLLDHIMFSILFNGSISAYTFYWAFLHRLLYYGNITVVLKPKSLL